MRWVPNLVQDRFQFVQCMYCSTRTTTTPCDQSSSIGWMLFNYIRDQSPSLKDAESTACNPICFQHVWWWWQVIGDRCFGSRHYLVCLSVSGDRSLGARWLDREPVRTSTADSSSLFTQTACQTVVSVWTLVSNYKSAVSEEICIWSVVKVSICSLVAKQLLASGQCSKCRSEMF